VTGRREQRNYIRRENKLKRKKNIRDTDIEV
jgi:hypothetical protein